MIVADAGIVVGVGLPWDMRLRVGEMRRRLRGN